MKFLFAASVGLILYAYFLYPLVLFVLAGAKQLCGDLRFGVSRRDRRVRGLSSSYPRVSLVFAAHNEATVIEQKMRNCQELDYPPHQLQVLIGCDGCTDDTPVLARAAAWWNVHVVEFAERRGKPEVLNQLVP